MPNNVRNQLCIKGPAKVLSEIFDHMKGDDAHWFDFNKLVPMPAALRDVQTGTTWIDGRSYSRWRVINDKSVPVSAEEEVNLKREYGSCDWYAWAVANWGTKWNVYGEVAPRRTRQALHYDFETAWGPAMPVYQALADKFKVTIVLRVSGEIDKKYKETITPTSN